ncbi:MAG TPA: GNAT family N-acetyltransferase [Lacunisphaera sp.]|nr:GNAT family N-acetyltransferase [Lacunisphaera sp.]
MSVPPVIEHLREAHRFETTIEGYRSVCEYTRGDGVMILTHTLVPPELRGRGVAEALVRAALAEARARGWRVVPQCSYVAKFIERHAEFQDLLAG